MKENYWILGQHMLSSEMIFSITMLFEITLGKPVYSRGVAMTMKVDVHDGL